MKQIVVALVGTLIAGSASAQNGPGSTVSYEGFFQIVAVTPGANGGVSPCTQYNLSVGNAGRIVYRFKNVASDPNDALALYFDESVYRMFSDDASGSLNGAVFSDDQLINPYANYVTRSGDQAGTSNLAFSTFGATPIGQAGNIRILGTIDNAFFGAGCTITIRAGLGKKPVQ